MKKGKNENLRLSSYTGRNILRLLIFCESNPKTTENFIYSQVLIIAWI